MLRTEYQIALVCSGISHIRRGYESFITDLALTFGNCDNVRLFQGSGPARSRNAVILPTAKRNGWAMKLFGPKAHPKRYRFEQLSFVFSGWALGHWRNCNLIYFSDPEIGNALYHLRKKFGYNYRLLYSNSGPITSLYLYERFDYIQQFSSAVLEEALEAGIPASKMTLLPMGINAKDFATNLSREKVREKYQLPTDKFIIITVSALDDSFKRLQWLIKSISEMRDPQLYLLLVGQNEGTAYAKTTLNLAERYLPGRYRHLMVPHSEIAYLYKASDIFVHAALQEGFGRVYLEAMASKVPVLCHDSAHTKWLVGHNVSRLNMGDDSSIQGRIEQLKTNFPLRLEIIEKNYNHLINCFEWQNLKVKYRDMFLDCLS